MSDFVIVPKSELKKLEEARVMLYDILDPMTINEQMSMQNVTTPMWLLANTKWEEYNGNV